jgi:hypothetical protein
MRKYDLESLFEFTSSFIPRVKLEHEINIPYKINIPSKPIKIEISDEIERTKVLNEMINQIKNRDKESSKC